MTVVRDLLEVALAVAVGGMLLSAVARVCRGDVVASVCRACGRPTSRAYPACTRCGAAR
ncbi:MAG: hypothetical protein ACRD0Q_09975 [Acidimicrobiales bacterium]